MSANHLVTKTVEVGNWKIDLVNDEDGHLSIHIDNSDGSEVNSVGADIADSENQWVERFTTVEIEKEYSQSISTKEATPL